MLGGTLSINLMKGTNMIEIFMAGVENGLAVAGLLTPIIGVIVVGFWLAISMMD